MSMNIPTDLIKEISGYVKTAYEPLVVRFCDDGGNTFEYIYNGSIECDFIVQTYRYGFMAPKHTRILKSKFIKYINYLLEQWYSTHGSFSIEVGDAVYEGELPFESIMDAEVIKKYALDALKFIEAMFGAVMSN